MTLAPLRLGVRILTQDAKNAKKSYIKPFRASSGSGFTRCPASHFLTSGCPGQADKFGKVEDGQIVILAELLAMRLWGISRLLGTSGRRPPGTRPAAAHSAPVSMMCQARPDGAAAVGLKGPVDGLGAQDFQEPLQVPGIFRILFVGDAGPGTMHP